MAFSRTWNAAYEAQPADTENISVGASRIRNLKSDIQERLEIDHFHAGDAQDGEHKKLTFGAPISTPANIANKGFLYGKDVSSKIELHWEDEDGNEIALTGAGGINAFPAGTKMLFVQTAAPAGWTKDVDQNDRMLRVVSGTPSSGGSWTVSGITVDSHTHSSGSLSTGTGGAHATGFASGGFGHTSQLHTHGVNGSTAGATATISSDAVWRPLYLDVIKCSKD